MGTEPPPDLTVVLLGKTGVGKSASGNTILRRKAFVSKLSLKPVTKEISEQTAIVFGKKISVVDTPGLLDTKDTKREITDFCEQLLQSSRRCLFLVVIRVGRFTEEDRKAVIAAMRVMGHKGLKRCYLLFTGGDALKGKSLEDFICEDEDEGTLPDIAKMYRGACHLFNNDDDDEEQVRELLQKSGHLRIQQQPDSPADVSRERRVVLLGLPGAGKSSCGNTILGCEKFRTGCDFNSVSAETVSESAAVEGCKVTVVDTPGFTDAVLTREQLYLEIMKSIVKATPGPHAFIIVVRIGRITRTDVELFKILPKLFDSNARKYSMVVFTHGDELKGQSIGGLIQSNRHVSELLSMCGGRYCVFDNTKTGNREQVRNLLNKVDEMVSANGGEHYTDEMFRMAETFFDEESNLAGGTTGGTTGGTAGGTTGGTTGGTAGGTTGGTTGGTAGGTTGGTAGGTTGPSAQPGGSGGTEQSVWRRLVPFLLIGAGAVCVAIGVVLCCATGGVAGCVGGGVAIAVGLGCFVGGLADMCK